MDERERERRRVNRDKEIQSEIQGENFLNFRRTGCAHTKSRGRNEGAKEE